ncbi:MAG: NfeD family protein [Bacteroidales bacterium]
MEADFFMNTELFWFLLGLFLLLLELVLPGFVVIFFGLGAWITALLCLVANPGLDLQIIVFTVTSLLSLILLRRMLKNRFFSGETESPATLEEEFINKVAVALTDIKKGDSGKVEFKGSTWTATSEEEINKGDKVIVTGKESISLIVKPKNK